MSEINYKNIPPILTSEEEKALCDRLSKATGAEAREIRNEFVARNIRFAIGRARNWACDKIDMADLEAAAIDGLMEAGRRFDPIEGTKFITYAVWWVDRHIKNFLNFGSKLIRFPANVVSAHGLLQDMLEDYEVSGKPAPSEEEMAEALGVRKESIGLVRSYSQLVLPITKYTMKEPMWNLEDKLAGPGPSADQEVIDREMNGVFLQLEENLGLLDERAADILRMLFGLNGESATLQEVGAKYGITRERARQLKEKALTTLRRRMKHCRYLDMAG